VWLGRVALPPKVTPVNNRQENRMNYLHAITLTSLSAEAQLAAAKTGDSQLCENLAYNTQLQSEAANLLWRDKRPTVKRLALRAMSDTDALNEHVVGTGLYAVAAASNPNTSHARLGWVTNSPAPRVALAAYCNDNTPLADKIGLTPDRASKLTEVGGNLAERVVRSYELVLANPWMKDQPEKWSHNLRRGMTGLPCLTLEESNKLDSCGYKQWASYQGHPARVGEDIQTLTTSELLQRGSSACDLVALTRSDLTEDDAFMVLYSRKVAAEPHVLARFIKRFGVGVILKPSRLSGSRFSGASWTNPAVEARDRVPNVNAWYDLQAASLKLGSSEAAWALFANMANNWGSSAEELAVACVAL